MARTNKEVTKVEGAKRKWEMTLNVGKSAKSGALYLYRNYKDNFTLVSLIGKDNKGIKVNELPNITKATTVKVSYTSWRNNDNNTTALFGVEVVEVL